MATSSTSSTFPKKINRYRLFLLSLLLIFFFCLFIFNRRALDSKFLYTDRISQPAAPIFLSSPRSTDKLADLSPPVSSLPNVDDNAEVSTRLSESEFRGESSDESVSSKSDPDDKTAWGNKVPFVSADSESQDNLGERDVEHVSLKEDTKFSEPGSQEESNLGRISSDSKSQDDVGEGNGEPISSNEEKSVHVSSKSLDDKSRGKSIVREKSEDDVGERAGDSMSSDEEITVPVASESDENGSEETASSDTDSGSIIDNAVLEKLRNCDIYKGTWVKDEGYPLYKPGTCPYVDDGYDCQSNGRPDSGYTQWRWKPDECELPRFNATDFLVRLRGKRLMLVGDSMNRNQFESLLCMLREGLADKSRMYETHGYKITKGRGYYIFKFMDYDCSVEFVRSHFLVREGVRINAQGNSNPTLSIDRIDKTSARWMRADILVFNTGHWWTHGKTARGKNYYKEGNYIHPRFDAVEAYRKAITTWATWIKKNIKRKKLVFYRGYSSAHFRGGDWDSGGTCNGETEPVVRGAIIDSYPQKMTVVEEVLKETQVPVVLLNVTRLTNYRKDGHPSIYGKNVTRLKKVSTRRQDCSHWCLPGVPDAWNELIYTTLVVRPKNSH